MRETDADIERQANDIFEQLRCLDKPADAGSVLILAQFYLIRASFEPEDRANALKLVDSHCNLLKSFVNEGWQ